MKNDYEVRGEITAIFLRPKRGGILETFIDTFDLSRAKEYSGTWSAVWSPKTESFVVQGRSEKVNGKSKILILHRWLFRLENRNILVDHIYHDTLDNRRSSMLRLVNNSQNMQNRKGIQKNHKSSGIRNVYWHNLAKKWRVQMKVEGKYLYFGLFENVAEAEFVAIEKRKIHMSHSAKAA